MFHPKSKNFKLGNKNAVFQYFLGWNLEKVLLYLKSAPSVFQNAKFNAKQKKHYNTSKSSLIQPKSALSGL